MASKAPPIQSLVNSLFVDPTAREIIDLATTLQQIARDITAGAKTPEQVRQFLSRNRAFLKYIIENYAKEKIEVDALIDKIMEAVELESVLMAGASLTLRYIREGVKRVKEQAEAGGGPRLV